MHINLDLIEVSWARWVNNGMCDSPKMLAVSMNEAVQHTFMHRSLLLTAPIARMRVSTRMTLPSTTPHELPNPIDAMALAVYGPTPEITNHQTV